MIRNDEHWLKLTDNFNAAALGSSSWETALADLAEACGARTGQLVGFGSDAAVPFNLMTEIDPQVVVDFVAVNGGDPKVNPRVRAGLASPTLKVLADDDYIVGDEMTRPSLYVDICRKYDIPFICQTNLIKDQELLIGLAVQRTARQGHITGEDRDAFKAIAPHVRTAVRTQIALEGRGPELLAGAMESLSMIGFVCDRLGRVRTMTQGAEQLVSDGNFLQLKLGYFRAALPADDVRLSRAIYEAANDFGPYKARLLRTIVVRRKSGEFNIPLVLDVIALPAHAHEFTFAARVLIVARGSRTSTAQNAFVLQTAFGLTKAEAEVALLLAAGHAVENISLHRAVAGSTVRSQVKSIFSKLGVSRQMELAALLKEFD